MRRRRIKKYLRLLAFICGLILLFMYNYLSKSMPRAEADVIILVANAVADIHS